MPTTTERTTLGDEIRRFRLKSGITLRKFALKAGISAAHLSDIEHNRGRPSAEALARIAAELRHVGVTYPALARLMPPLGPQMPEWVAATAEVRQMARAGRAPNRKPPDVP